MMVGALGKQRHARHEAECANEIVEAEAAPDRVPIGIERPAGQVRGDLPARLGVQSCDAHDPAPSCSFPGSSLSMLA
jgi:hypothetical protein